MRKGILLGLALFAMPAAAAEGDLEYRKEVYTAIGGHMKATAAILQQKVPHADHLALHANALADLSTTVKSLFPAGSEGGDALPAIWSNPDDFAARATTFEEAAAGFKTAAASGENVGPAFQQLAQSCKGCHDNYRKE
jgi:cytochrome c556